MATPVRLPIRSFLRSATTSNPATKIHRTPCCSRIITQTQSRYSSTEDSSIWDITHKRAAPASADGKNAEAIEDEKYAYPDLPENVRFPRAVEATYLRPLRREAEYGIPSCDLQLRSYSVRNLEFFADFAMRAAYYLNLPAYGPIPLPRIVERWTVPLGHFIHKKSQENFERKTLRRMIQIKDGNEETVGIWLAFLEKHAYYGVGMKANVWSFDKLGVGKHMDAQMQDMRKGLQDTLDSIAFKKNSETAEKIVEVLNRENFRMASGQRGLMQEGRTQKQDEARPWKHPNIPSDAAQRAVRRGV